MKNSEQTTPSASVPRLVRRAKRLLQDLEDEGLVLSLLSPGGQPFAAIHPEDKSYECSSYCCNDPEFHNLGTAGVGEMIAL